MSPTFSRKLLIFYVTISYNEKLKLVLVLQFEPNRILETKHNCTDHVCQIKEDLLHHNCNLSKNMIYFPQKSQNFSICFTRHFSVFPTKGRNPQKRKKTHPPDSCFTENLLLRPVQCEPHISTTIIHISCLAAALCWICFL